MNKKSISRDEAEKAEGFETIKQDVPENKLQTEQQVQNSDAALHTKPADGSFAKKHSQAKGETLKQEVISEAITGSSDAAGMGINAAGRGVSGTNGGVLGANNSTPYADKSRSESRLGKKLDRIATKLNYTPSEQVLVTFDESKPLADSSGEDQGYNGTYRNENARSQKIMGAVPADLMFQRSVDLILKDKLYFVEGQFVFQSGDDTTAYNPSTRISMVDGEPESVAYHTGNFLHQGMHIGLDTNGKVTYCYFDVDDLTKSGVDQEEANISSAHRLIKANVAELDRMVMDTKAGDEKADLWTPLARAVDQPTATSFLLSSIEADTGAYAYLAYSKAATNMAYQLNRAPKDGLSVITPAIEQLVGWRSNYSNSVDLASAFNNSLRALLDPKTGDVVNPYFKLGDPSLMITAYDSPAKYNNKADLLLQPRGWRMHLQTADNNINPLKCPTEFANVYNATECFSTINREYDPLLPICMTDKANLITSHNFNELAAFYKDAIREDLEISYTATAIAASYKYTQVKMYSHHALKYMGYPATAKLYVFGKTNSTKGHQFLWDNTGTAGIIKLDPDDSNDSPTLSVALRVNESTLEGYTLLATLDYDYSKDIYVNVPEVQDASGTTISVVSIDVISEPITLEWYGAGHFAYRYADLRNNYIVDVQHPLVNGIVEWCNNAIGGKIRSLLAQEEFYIPLVFSTQYMTLAQLVICAATPWILKVRTNSMKDVIYYEDNIHQYPFSKLDSIKNLPLKNFVNFGFQDYDHPLETKIMNPVQAINWIMPEFLWNINTDTYVLPWYFNENDLQSDGSVDPDSANMSMPSIRSGVRLAALDTLYGMSEKDIRLSLDRMTKYLLSHSDITNIYVYKYGRTTDGQPIAVMDTNKYFSVYDILSATRELGLSMDAPLGILTRDPLDNDAYGTHVKALTANGKSTSFRIKCWTNVNTVIAPSILNANGININRAANYSQKWVELYANGATSDTEILGLCFGMADDVAAYEPVAALNTAAQVEHVATVTSYQRSINTRLQFLPFVISPFDGTFTGINNPVDIYDFCYYFGLAGFRASDYRESIYNREKEVVNQGMTFVEDPWIVDSPIIKGSAQAMGTKLSKGYELK